MSVMHYVRCEAFRAADKGAKACTDTSKVKHILFMWAVKLDSSASRPKACVRGTARAHTRFLPDQLQKLVDLEKGSLGCMAMTP